MRDFFLGLIVTLQVVIIVFLILLFMKQKHIHCPTQSTETMIRKQEEKENKAFNNIKWWEEIEK